MGSRWPAALRAAAIAGPCIDPQVQHLGTFTEITHPVHGPQMTIRRPFLYDGSRDDQPLNAAPDLGEHSVEILKSLGLSAEAIETVRRGE